MPTITRRDFLGGTALAIAAGLTPLDQLRAATQALSAGADRPARQPSRRLRVRPQLGREGETFDFSGKPVEEEYDLVVVGGGISGLAAAWFYREAHGDAAKILILENHDDFGGHAKRNEFSVDGRPLLIGYGGSESMEAPHENFSETVARVMQTLGVDIDALRHGIRPGPLWRARPVARRCSSTARISAKTGWSPAVRSAAAPIPTPGNTAKTQTIPDFVGAFPLSEDARKRLTDFFASPKDYLAGKIDGREDRPSREHQLSRLSQAGRRARRRGRQVLRRPDARLFRGRHRRGVGLRRDVLRLCRLRRARHPAGGQSPRQRALYLPFPGRQCVDRAAAGAQPHPGGSGGLDDGRHRAGGFRLFEAGPGRPADPHPPVQHRAQRPQFARRQGAGRYRLCQGGHAAPRAGRSSACSPATT